MTRSILILTLLVTTSCKKETNQETKESTTTAITLKKKPKEIKSLVDVNFKLLMDFELPLADSTIAEEQDLKALQESIPKEVKDLHDSRIRIKGFMVPLELNEQNLVSKFLFAPDQTSCCYGNVPNLNGFIYCTSPKGLPNLKDILLELTGTFKSKPEYDTDNEVVFLYKMTAESYKELSPKQPLNDPPIDF